MMGHRLPLILFFDFRGQRLYLAPNARAAERQTFDACGVRFIMEPEETATTRLVATTVIAGSPAALAGVRKGDVLESIDGQAANGLTVRQIGDLLSRPGERRTLRLRRDGRPVVATFTLIDRL